MDYFNCLPVELIEIIFKKMNLNDLINLRIVNKRFKLICERIKIKQLIVNDWSDNRFWFYTNDIVNLNEDNLTTINEIIKYKSIFQLDKNLKRLFLNVEDFSFDLSILNEFESLEQLKIVGIPLSEHCRLYLKNLKIADCFNRYPEFKIIFITPELFAFRSPNRLNDNFIFNYPSKILIYETHQEYNDDIKIFTNLECLKLEEIDRIDRNILFKFKKLKILDLILTKRFNRRYDELKRDINYLINLKENLNRTELQIYLQGVKLINQNKIHELKFQCEWNEIDYNNLEFQMKNYNLLKDNSSLSNKINYCDVIKFIDKIPLSFKNKFSQIHKVYAKDQIVDEDQFIKFLNNLIYLSSLYLINCELNKTFYDKLINLAYLYDLNELKIDEKTNLAINFEFILNLKQLKEFETNQKINNIDLIHRLLIKNKKINDLKFSIEKNKIKIKTIYLENIINAYQLKLCDNLNKNEIISEFNLNDLILKLKTIQ